jgi:acid phosphatase
MKLLIKSSLALLFLALCFGCNDAGKNKKGNQGDSASIPKPDHIIVVIEENHGYDQIIGATEAPYINQLAKEGALFTASHGVTHPSQPNYIAIFSGSLQGVKGDECLKDTSFNTPNLGAALFHAGYTFKGYGETMPSIGFRECYYQKSTLTKAYLYGRKHCPWVNWLGTGNNQLPDSISLPMNKFPGDFSRLPTVAFVIPNMDNDMHNNGGDTSMVRRADSWLQEHLSKYISWAKTHNSLLILTYDEDDFTPHNHIPTIFVGAHVNPGKYSDSINHYNVLRTMEHMYGLPPSGSAKASLITKVWK